MSRPEEDQRKDTPVGWPANESPTDNRPPEDWDQFAKSDFASGCDFLAS